MNKTTSLLLLIGLPAAALLIFAFTQGLFTSGSMQPDDLGVKDGSLAPMPETPNAVSSQTDIADKKVAPLPMRGSMEQTRETILAVLRQMGRNSVQKSEPDYIHTVFVSPLMKYHDDVELFIDEKNGLVHFRSASRVGYSDLGANKKRYEAFRTLYMQE